MTGKELAAWIADFKELGEDLDNGGSFRADVDIRAPRGRAKATRTKEGEEKENLEKARHGGV